MKFRIVSAVIVGGAVLLSSLSAWASFSVTLTDNSGNSQTFSGVTAGKIRITLSTPGTNLVTNAGFIADFSNLDITADPTGSSPGQALVQTTQIQLTNAANLKNLTVMVSDDFTTPTPPLTVNNNGGLNTTDITSGTATVHQQTLIDGTAVTTNATNTLTGVGAASFASPQVTGVIPGPPFPISPNLFTMQTDIFVDFTNAAGATTSYSGNIQSSSSANGNPTAVVPEPASILVWSGLMMAGVFGAVRLRRSSH